MRERKSSGRAGLVTRLTLAYSFWALLFILVPLIFVAYYAFTDADQHTFDNVSRFFTATSTVTDGAATKEVHTYLLIFLRSLKLAAISTFICLLMGYPLAYIMAGSLGQNAEDHGHSHNDTHVDELPYPHLCVDDHIAGYRHAKRSADRSRSGSGAYY